MVSFRSGKSWHSIKEPSITTIHKLVSWKKFAVCRPHSSLSDFYEWISPRCRHQGQWLMLYLLQEWFWWPSMAIPTLMQKAISNCKQCIQHEGSHAKAPMQPIIATTPFELLHMDFMTIEMTLELDQPLNEVNILVFCNHFTKHVMVYMIPTQTAKTVAKFLWQGYSSIFRALAKLLSDWGANFESNVIKVLCELMGIWKVRT